MMDVMSLLIADVVPEGLMFAADRNLSSRGRHVDVREGDQAGELLAGYVGVAELNDQPLEE